MGHQEDDIPTPLAWAVVLSALVTLMVIALCVVILLIYQRRLAASAQRWGRSLLRAQEDERKRLAVELHDDVLQRLHGAQLQLEARGGSGVETASALIQGVTGDLRRLAHDLFPPAMHGLGLLGSIRDLAAQYSVTSGPEISVVSNTEDLELKEKVAISLYRITQEAVRNSIVHGKAARVRIELEKRPQEVALSIADAGAGMPDIRALREGFGIRSMRERATECGGAITIASSVGGGTRVIATVPLE